MPQLPVPACFRRGDKQPHQVKEMPLLLCLVTPPGQQTELLHQARGTGVGWRLLKEIQEIMRGVQ